MPSPFRLGRAQSPEKKAEAAVEPGQVVVDKEVSIRRAALTAHNSLIANTTTISSAGNAPLSTTTEEPANPFHSEFAVLPPQQSSPSRLSSPSPLPSETSDTCLEGDKIEAAAFTRQLEEIEKAYQLNAAVFQAQHTRSTTPTQSSCPGLIMDPHPTYRADMFTPRFYPGLSSPPMPAFTAAAGPIDARPTAEDEAPVKSVFTRGKGNSSKPPKPLYDKEHKAMMLEKIQFMMGNLDMASRTEMLKEIVIEYVSTLYYFRIVSVQD
jgi:hypothetical protein